MIRVRCAGWAVLLALGAAWSQEAPNLRLTLPPDAYAVVGQPFSIYYDNLVLTETPEAYTFTVQCPIGACEERRWTVTPAQAGDYPLSVEVKDAAGKSLGQASTKLHVARADAASGRSLTVLIIGDSLTANGAYASHIGSLLAAPGNPTWSMLGTNKTGAAMPEVAHEGYGGWTWQRFATHYEPNPDLPNRKFSSPFVVLDAEGKPKLDVAQYFDTKFAGKRPDVITLLLGINDCFGANPDDPASIDARIDAMFAQADLFLNGLREAAPTAALAVGITTPPNSRESGFEANYKGKYHRWGWKRIQHRIVERMITKFQGREAEGLYLVPTELDVDPVDGYPDNNGVHPNRVGYQQIGNSFYAWIKWHLQTAAKG